MSLVGKVAVVTGGGSGIGAAISKALGTRGARVAVVDVDSDAAERVAAELHAGSARALAVEADVTEVGAVKEMVQAVRDEFGPVSVLVNNAAICPMTPFDEISLDEWNTVLAVNLTGAFLCSQAVIPDMAAQGWGRIVNISSLAGQVGGLIVGAHYAASKGGLLALTKSLARVGAPGGVTANAIAPGTVNTPMRREFTGAQQEALVEAGVIKRVASPEEIAAGVLYLISNDAGYVTGQTLSINGGALMA